jgi:predicted SAM-dependent methyltransferase
MKNPYYESGASYHRNMLNFLSYKNRDLYKGIVLDIGGINKAIFKFLKKNVEKWIISDINPENNPDIILDVAAMHPIESESIDVINAHELFEHVYEIKKGLKECARVLKEGGIIIISVPFIHYVHGLDFQRWTHIKWIRELNNVGLQIEKFIIMGTFFTSISNMLKIFVIEKTANISFLRKIILKISYIILDFLVKLDNKKVVKNNPRLHGFHNGYYIIARKT